MLKNKGIAGAYHDENISVGVLLENPLDYGLEATELVFSVTITAKSESAALNLKDFAFYIMDETNHIHNAHVVPHLSQEADPNDDGLVRRPDCLLCAEFKPEFLFQDLRVTFYYAPYGKFHIIELRL
jgi:hypothetical protein